MEPSPLYGTPFDPVVFDGLVAGLSDHEVMEREFDTPPWMVDQYAAATGALRLEFPTIAARFQEAGGSTIWLDDPSPSETATLMYAVLRHVAESCPHYSMEAAGPYVVLLDESWLGRQPCAHRRVETSLVDDDARCRLCDEEPEEFVPMAIGFPGTLIIADICLSCRDRFTRA